MVDTNDHYRRIVYPQERQVCEGWIYERPCTQKPKWTLYPSGSAYCTYHKRHYASGSVDIDEGSEVGFKETLSAMPYKDLRKLQDILERKENNYAKL
jgi:hypothetical protein